MARTGCGESFRILSRLMGIAASRQLRQRAEAGQCTLAARRLCVRFQQMRPPGREPPPPARPRGFSGRAAMAAQGRSRPDRRRGRRSRGCAESFRSRQTANEIEPKRTKPRLIGRYPVPTRRARAAARSAPRRHRRPMARAGLLPACRQASRPAHADIRTAPQSSWCAKAVAGAGIASDGGTGGATGIGDAAFPIGNTIPAGVRTDPQLAARLVLTRCKWGDVDHLTHRNVASVVGVEIIPWQLSERAVR